MVDLGLQGNNFSCVMYMGNTPSDLNTPLSSKASIIFKNIDSKPNLSKTKSFVKKYANFKSLNPPVRTTVQSVKYDKSNKIIICHVKLSKSEITKKEYHDFIKDDLRGPFESNWDDAPHENMKARNITVVFETKKPATKKKKPATKRKKPAKKKKKKPATKRKKPAKKKKKKPATKRKKKPVKK